MHISWLGLSALKIETAGAVLVTDPFAPQLAGTPLRAKADLVCVSAPASETANHLSGILGAPFVVQSPGEFEVKGVSVHGYPLGDTIVYALDVEGMRLAHFGQAKELPSSELLEQLNGIDLLFLPVGGGSVFDPASALKVVNAIEPSVVIPMFFATEGLKLKAKLLPAENFLREMGASRVEPIERLTLKKKDLKEEETRVVLLRVY